MDNIQDDTISLSFLVKEVKLLKNSLWMSVWTRNYGSPHRTSSLKQSVFGFMPFPWRAIWRQRVNRNKRALATEDVHLLHIWTLYYWGPMQSHLMFGLAGHANEDNCNRKASDDGGVGTRRGSPRYFRFMDSKLQNLIKLPVSLFGLLFLLIASFFGFIFLSCLQHFLVLVPSLYFSFYIIFTSLLLNLPPLQLSFFSFIFLHTINLFLLLYVILF
jgi:hypothetical protein